MPGPWSPSHTLTWTPRFGVVCAWPVRITSATDDDGRRIQLAQTMDEHHGTVPPAWVFDLESELWTWCGQGGYEGDAGAVRLERLGD